MSKISAFLWEFLKADPERIPFCILFIFLISCRWIILIIVRWCKSCKSLFTKACWLWDSNYFSDFWCSSCEYLFVKNIRSFRRSRKNWEVRSVLIILKNPWLYCWTIVPVLRMFEMHSLIWVFYMMVTEEKLKGGLYFSDSTFQNTK